MELGLAGEAGDREAALSNSDSSLSVERFWLLFFYLNFNHVINSAVENQKLSSLTGK